MQYRIGRDGNELGSFSENEVREGLTSGQFLPSDLGWQEGMASWSPLRELFPSQPPPITAGPSFASSPATPPAITGSAPVLQAQSSGLAVTALVLGIISAVTCGGLVVGALAAIICGHIALAKINKSNGLLKGRGQAIAGLVMGYVTLITGVAMLAALAVPTYARIQERGQIVVAVMNARNLVLHLRDYGEQNDGKLPERLEKLVEADILTQESFDQLTNTPGGENAFEYFGEGVTINDDGSTIILKGTPAYSAQRTVVGYLDGSARLESETDLR